MALVCSRWSRSARAAGAVRQPRHEEGRRFAWMPTLRIPAQLVWANNIHGPKNKGPAEAGP